MRMKTTLLAGAALAGALGLASGACAQDMTYRWQGAPRFTNDDATFKVRGRILIDAVYQSVNRQTGIDYHTRNFRGRQAFLGVEGTINSQFAYKAEGGAVNGGAWGWDDVVIEWKATETTSVLVGNIKAAGLENLTSTRFTTFMDRGPYGDIGPDSYLVSAVVKHTGPNWSVTGAVQGASLNTGDVTANGLPAGSRPTGASTTSQKERLGFTVRGHWAPITTDTDKVHLGLYARKRNNGTETAFAFSPRPNVNAIGNFISTPGISDSDTTYGVESAWVHNNLSIQGEYSEIDINRFQSTTTYGRDPKVKVGYAFVSFWPTGEMRNYNQVTGEFGRPKILNPVTAGGMGGVELALRYDYADLTDVYNTTFNTQRGTAAAPANGFGNAGKYTAVTAGVNYYPFAYVRVQANYTKGKSQYPTLNGAPVQVSGVGNKVDIDQFQLRAQIDF